MQWVSSVLKYFLDSVTMSCNVFLCLYHQQQAAEMLCCQVMCLAVCCLSINTYFTWHDISLHSGGISMKPATNIHHVSGNCSKGFQGHRSKVKVMCVQMYEWLEPQMYTCWWCDVEAYLLLSVCRLSVLFVCLFSVLRVMRPKSNKCIYVMHISTQYKFDKNQPWFQIIKMK